MTNVYYVKHILRELFLHVTLNIIIKKATLNSSGCVYYFEDDFNRMISDNNCISNFSLLHINARSLCKNLNNITSYLDRPNHKFAVIAVSKTWANISNESLLIIPGYNRVMKNRAGSRGSGIALYV